MTSNAMTLCERCTVLRLTRSDFASPPFEPESKYHQVIVEGTIGQLRECQARCALCRILLQALSREYQGRPDARMADDEAWEAEWYQNIIEYDPVADGAEEQYAVYGNSALTIVAASGAHADAGLEGWGQHMEAGSRQSTVKIEDGFILGVLPFFDLELMNSIFASRGWTYQETALSARRLIFLGGQFYFVCRGAVWREDVMAESNLIQPFEGANTLGTGASEWTLGRYGEHVAAYSSRKLTYSSDALNAFAGIQKALQGSMGNTKFWYALPAGALDWALLWKATKGTKLARREEFPSWSWTGWDGPVTHPPYLPSSDDQKWLRQRTWIDWRIFNDEGTTVRAWERLNKSFSRSSELSGSQNSSSQSKPQSEDGSSCANSEIESSNNEDLGDFMPTYGMSLRGHPFTGRMKARNPPVDTGTSTATGSGGKDKLSPGTLVFKTQVHLIGDTIELSLASAYDDADDFEHQIIDKKTQKVCGLVWTKDVLPRPGSGKGDWVALLALSFAAPSTLDRKALEDGGLDGTYLQTAAQETSVDGERIFEEWHEWDFFNVMLVHGQGDTVGKMLHAERRGLGLMHRDVLMDETCELDFKVIALR